MQEKYMCQLQFQTRYFDFDFQDELKLSSLLNFMQEAGGISANELGCGYDYLLLKGWGFILTNNYVEIYKSIKINEPLTVKTWPLPPRHVQFERHYELYDQAGEKVAAALSKWCLIDLVNKKILPSTVLVEQDYSMYNTRKSIDFNAWKIQPVSVEAIQPSFEMQVTSSDYDHYMHVNNTRYADFCVNCFTVEELKNRKIVSFQISYEQQCKEEEKLQFYRVLLSKNEQREEYLILGIKDGNSQFMKAKISFLIK